MSPSFGTTPTGQCLFCIEDPRAGFVTSGDISWGVEKRENCAPWLAGYIPFKQPRIWWLSELQRHFDNSFIIFHLSISPSPSWQGCSQSVIHPVCINTWDCVTQVQDLEICLADFHEVYISPLLKPVKILLDTILSLKWINCAIQLVSPAKLQRVHSISLSMSLMKICNNVGPSINPWGTAFTTGLQLDIEALTIILWGGPSSQFLI